MSEPVKTLEEALKIMREKFPGYSLVTREGCMRHSGGMDIDWAIYGIPARKGKIRYARRTEEHPNFEDALAEFMKGVEKFQKEEEAQDEHKAGD